MSLKLRQVIIEDFVNYKKPSIFLAFPYCNQFKCGKNICQNSELVKSPIMEFDYDDIIKWYNENPITKAYVFGGLEPLDSFTEMYTLIKRMREEDRKSDIVIYTGYERTELDEYVKFLSLYPNIIIKCGRYIPNRKSVFDEILGVTLASDNQYAFYAGVSTAHCKIHRADPEIAKEILKTIKENDGYCPCKFEKTKDTKCMCKEFRMQELGWCECGLYCKEEI